MQSEIQKIYSKNLVTVKDHESLLLADKVMKNHNIRHLPVVDSENNLVGILAKSDFLALKKIDSNLAYHQIKNFMSSPVKVFNSNTKVKHIAKLFIDSKISSALIVEFGTVVGIVTSEDLIKILADKDNLNLEAEKMDLAELASEGWISMTTLT